MKIRLIEPDKDPRELELAVAEEALPVVMCDGDACFLIQNIERAGSEPVGVYSRITSTQVPR